MKKLLIASVLCTSILLTNASADTFAPDGTYVSGDSAQSMSKYDINIILSMYTT